MDLAHRLHSSAEGNIASYQAKTRSPRRSIRYLSQRSLVCPRFSRHAYSSIADTWAVLRGRSGSDDIRRFIHSYWCKRIAACRSGGRGEGGREKDGQSGRKDSEIRLGWYTGYGGAFLCGVWALYEISFAWEGKRERGWRAVRCDGGWTIGKVWGLWRSVESTEIFSLSCCRDSISVYKFWVEWKLRSRSITESLQGRLGLRECSGDASMKRIVAKDYETKYSSSYLGL
jgi:hypothetical protein